MLDQKKMAQIDQEKEAFVEVMPGFWKSLYDGLVEAGFNEIQSMELLKAYISKV